MLGIWLSVCSMRTRRPWFHLSYLLNKNIKDYLVHKATPKKVHITSFFLLWITDTKFMFTQKKSIVNYLYVNATSWFYIYNTC